MFLWRQRLISLRKKSFGRHSERSEESLLIQNKSLREILRAKSALRMTAFRLFQQSVKPLNLHVLTARLNSLRKNREDLWVVALAMT
jgi:hypothetical protein